MVEEVVMSAYKRKPEGRSTCLDTMSRIHEDFAFFTMGAVAFLRKCLPHGESIEYEKR